MFNDTLELASKINSILATYASSPSHDHFHTDLVLNFAEQLQEIHGGNKEILTAAVLLHDLGRINPNLHGIDSVHHSLDLAKEILDKVKFPKTKVEFVLKAIEEHDQPLTRPSTLEGQLLKDADFLAGFGAWGILRIALWAGETNGGIPQIKDRLENRMLERFRNLEFPESQRWARKEILFSNYFLEYWKDTQVRRLEKYKGIYIILEGISGSGKDTQVELLRNYLEKRGYKITSVSEPADTYHLVRDLWENEYKKMLEDPILRRFNLLADRYNLTQSAVIPALERGEIVISNRSFLSFLVYQCYNDSINKYDEMDFAEMAMFHRFVPVPDMILLLDLEPDLAMKRILERKKERSRFEEIKMLRIHRSKYLSIVNSSLFGLNYEIVNAGKTVEMVALNIRNSIDRLLGIKNE